MLEEAFKGYAHVLALPAKLDEAFRIARKQSKALRCTVYIGERKRQYVVWRHIATDKVASLKYDSKLKTMPWLDLRELAKPYEYKFES
jgi:hypothetical protein